MSYCPKCGSKISEEMTFCPNCGASLKTVQPAVAAPPTAPPRGEKAEKGEKQEKREKEARDQREKREKGEKHEKRQYGFAGPLIGGLVLIFFGLMLFIGLINPSGTNWGILGAFFVVIIGIIIIIGAIYAATMASRRHPST
jgi:hypothetical protein